MYYRTTNMLYPFLIHYQYAFCCSHGELEHAGTPQHHVTIQSAVIGVIGVGLEGVRECCWLVKESRNHCAEKEIPFPQTPDFCFFLCQLRLLHEGFSPCLVPPVKGIALTFSIYCFHMRAVISLANGNETQNCNKWGHATECRCSLLLAQSTHARSN